MQMGLQLEFRTPPEMAGAATAKELSDWEDSAGDLLDHEEGLRNRMRDPSYKESWGDTSVSKERREDLAEVKEFGQTHLLPEKKEMKEFALLICIMLDGVACTTIPGFTDLLQCQRQAEIVKQNFTFNRGRPYSICIEVRK